MNKVLLSSVLVGLLSVSAEATAVTESNNQIVFNASGDTFTPTASNGVYLVNQNKTIQVGNGLASAKIKGGIDVTSGKITINMMGLSTPISSQSLVLGKGSGASTIFEVGSRGSVEFDFTSLGSVKTQQYNIEFQVDNQDANSGKIVNDGKIDFALGKNTKLMFYKYENMASSAKATLLPLKNSGEMNFNLSEASEIILNNTTIQNSTSGLINFKIADNSKIYLGMYTSLSQITNNGSIIFDFSNRRNASVEGGILRNQSLVLNTAQTIFKFKNASNIYFGDTYETTIANLDSGNKDGVLFAFTGNSLVTFANIVLQNASVDFQGRYNLLSIKRDWQNQDQIYTQNIRWLDCTGEDNAIVLTALTDNEAIDTSRLEVNKNKFTFLEIGERGAIGTGILSSGINFIVHANISGCDLLGQDIQAIDGKYTYADRVIIHSSQNTQIPSIHNLGVIVAPSMLKYLDSVSYTPKTTGEKDGDVTIKGNIAVASVANVSNVKLKALSENILGFNLIETSFEEVQTNAEGVIDGTNGYTTYFIKSARDAGVSPITQEVTSSVFALNYDLFIANFNSLNKRMGDLRNNPYSQGAWGRIFNGQLSNDFGLGSANNYTTLQAGYDYDFSLSNAKNYLGVAFAYGFSISEMSSNASNALQNREIKDIFSNNIEFALYNAYVEDSGLYSDSIAKFSYLISNFNLTNNGVSEKLNVDNYAFQLSEEVGYVFSLGGNKEWSITPQAELSLGYYSDSDLTQVAGDFYLDAKAKSMLMLRARAGAMVGYDFKQYTQGKDIITTLYAGLSYEYDYLSGGEIELTPNVGKAITTKSALSSDGRGVLNLGTNITLKDDIRLYADFQTSFGGKINTDYQINIGARFSFGEKGEGQKIKEETPLKIEG